VPARTKAAAEIAAADINVLFTNASPKCRTVLAGSWRIRDDCIQRRRVWGRPDAPISCAATQRLSRQASGGHGLVRIVQRWRRRVLHLLLFGAILVLLRHLGGGFGVVSLVIGLVFRPGGRGRAGHAFGHPLIVVAAGDDTLAAAPVAARARPVASRHGTSRFMETSCPSAENRWASRWFPRFLPGGRGIGISPCTDRL